MARFLTILLASTALASAQPAPVGPVDHREIPNAPLLGGSNGTFTPLQPGNCQIVNGALNCPGSGGSTIAPPSSSFIGSDINGQIIRNTQRIRVEDPPYNAKCDGVTDDSLAFKAAFQTALASAGTYVRPSIHIPAGTCVIGGAAGTLPVFYHIGVGIDGEGRAQSWLKIATTYPGPWLLAWSDSWQGGAGNWPIVGSGNTVNIVGQFTGPSITNLSIVGDRSSPVDTVAVDFQDRDDLIFMANVDILYVKGSGIRFGHENNVTTQAAIRESWFDHIRIWNTGDGPAFPAWDMGVTGAGFADNEIDITNVDIYGPVGHGIWMHNGGNGAYAQFRMANIRIEGTEGNPAGLSTDLWRIGDPADTAPVSDVTAVNVELVDAYGGGGSALHFASNTTASRAFNDRFLSAQVSGGLVQGNGVKIDGGRNLWMQFSNLNHGAGMADIVIASSATVGLINFDLMGVTTYVANIDPTSVGNVHTLLYGGLGTAAQAPVYLSASQVIAGCPPDNTTTCGNARGVGAVDLQMTRTGAAQVAQVASSTIGGGGLNVAQNSYATIAGGFNNSLSGQYSASPGGRQCGDSQRYGTFCFASGEFANQGDAQLAHAVMRGRTVDTTPVRLVGDGSGAASTTLCFNQGNGHNNTAAYSVTVSITDATNAGHYAYHQPLLMSSWDTAVSETLLAIGTAQAGGTGTLSALTTGAISITNDGPNRCPNITFTPPAGNTDTLDAVAVITAAESG